MRKDRYKYLVLIIMAFTSVQVMLVSCAAKNGSDYYFDTIRTAENFLKRNGYTQEGHPSDLPVNIIDPMDSLFLTNEADKKKLLEMRRGKVEGPAYCVILKKNVYYVSFSDPRNECPVIVSVTSEGNAGLVHGCVSTDFLTGCKVVP